MKKYSDKTIKEARLILLNHFQNLTSDLMTLEDITPESYEKIITEVMERDEYLLEELGLIEG